MMERSTPRPVSTEAAEREARRATAALLGRIDAERRRAKRRARWWNRDRAVDVVVAMATYTGLTVAMALGAVCGIRAVYRLFVG